jgi:hypothetical protein
LMMVICVMCGNKTIYSVVFLKYYHHLPFQRMNYISTTYSPDTQRILINVTYHINLSILHYTKHIHGCSENHIQTLTLHKNCFTQKSIIVMKQFRNWIQSPTWA